MRLNALFALFALFALSGCSHLETLLRGSAREKGRAEARVTLPNWPSDCRQSEAHAPLVVGSEIRSILKRERTQLNRANARVGRCAGHYDGLRKKLK